MKKDKKSSGYWTLKTNCRKAAKRCKSKSELCKRFPSAYFSSVKNGWIDEFFPNSTKRGKLFWTKENCREEAKKYKTRSEFSFKCNRAYRVSLDNGWLNDFFPPSNMPKRPKKIWTKEECAEIAAQCNGRIEFCKKKASAYRYAQQQGWLDEFFGVKNKITKEKCRKSAEYYKKSSLLKKYAPAVYKKCIFSGWLEEFFPDEMNTITANEKTIRHRILDFVEANGPQTKDDLYRIMLTIAGQNIKRRDWGIAYVDNVSYGTSVFLPTKSDKRYLKQVRDFDFKTPKYGIAEVKKDEE